MKNDTLIKKTIKSLQLSDNSVVKKDDEILREAKSFYQILYTSTVAPKNDLYDDLFFPEGNTLILNELEQQERGGPLTETECWGSLKSMQSNKIPGSDGLPAEFYKLFWKEIHPYLLNALNYAYRNGLLSVTQKRGLITLIPKKNKAANFLKNRRPITLLNCDYKIASKCIASRIQKFLPRLIDNDQTGFLKNRFIGENMRLVEPGHSNLKRSVTVKLEIRLWCYKQTFWRRSSKLINQQQYTANVHTAYVANEGFFFQIGKERKLLWTRLIFLERCKHSCTFTKWKFVIFIWLELTCFFFSVFFMYITQLYYHTNAGSEWIKFFRDLYKSSLLFSFDLSAM